jgi:hypothetical protein
MSRGPILDTIETVLTAFSNGEWSVRESQFELFCSRIDIASDCKLPDQAKQIIRDTILWNVPVTYKVEVTFSRKKQC